MISCMMVTHVTQSHNIEKDVEGFRIDNIIQHSNSILALQSVYRL